jgi:very-short-patch-repair endonuclease
VHESKVIDHWDLRVVDGIPSTSPERTLLDLGAVVGPSLVELAVDDALRRELVSRATLEAALGRLGRSGRNGAGVLRRVMELRGWSLGATASYKETRLLQLLRRQGLPDPTPQFEVYDASGWFLGRVDAAYPRHRIAIEYESIAHHTGSDAVQHDSARRNQLIGAGWTVVTVTAADVRDGCRAVAQTLRTLLASPAQL